MSKRVLFVNCNIAARGAERVLVEQAKAMLNLGISVKILIRQNTVQYDLKGMDVTYIPFSFSYSTFSKSAFSFEQELLEFLNDFKPHIILSHTHYSALAVAVLINRNSLNIKNLGFLHYQLPIYSNKFNFSKVGIIQQINKRKAIQEFKKANSKLICIARKDLEYYLPFFPSVELLENPVFEYLDEGQLTKKLSRTQNEFQCISVGALDQIKNHEFLIKVFSEIRKVNSKIKLAIYGEGHLLTHLEKLINENELTDTVSLKGVSNTILEELYNSQVFLMPSISEAKPMALLEACGQACVPIVNNVGDMPFMVEHNKGGYVLEVENPTNWVIKILELERDRLLWSKHANSAYQFILSTHSKQRYFNQLTTLF